jgi:phage shock protein A
MRPSTSVSVLAALAVSVLAGGCDAVDKAVDCAQTARAIATSVDNLREAAERAVDDPTQADESLDAIDKELSDLEGKVDDADLSKAVDDLNEAVTNVRSAMDDGDRTLDIGPVIDAADEISEVCTS